MLRFLLIFWFDVHKGGTKMSELMSTEDNSRLNKHRWIAILLCIICVTGAISVKTPVRQVVAMCVERVFIYIDEWTHTEMIESEMPQVKDLKLSVLTIKDMSNYKKVVRNKETLDKGDLILVNSKHLYKEMKNKDIHRKELVNISKHKNDAYKIMDEDIFISKVALQHFNAMMEDFEKQTGKHDIIVTSGYRTLSNQIEILKEKTALYGKEDALDWAMLPGFSEHHTGYAMDISIYTDQGNYIRYRGQDEYRWINENSYKYGLIRRYSGEKKDITGIANEEWHYRYVGVPHSYIITAKDICFEEYINYIKQYTKDKHLKIKCPQGKYEIYFVPSVGDETEVWVPRGKEYSISGNNVDGFIVTVKR